MISLAGQTALVTGSSHGIGSAIATSMARAGADIVMTYRDKDAASRLVATIEQMGRKVWAISCDFTQDDQFSEFLHQAFSEKDRTITILVNNVGILTRTGILDITEDQLRRVMRVNFERPFALSQHFSRRIIEENQNGVILNISSLSANLTRSMVAHYQSSKAALNMLTKSLATELGCFGIRANTIVPGLTATNANQDQWKHHPELWQSRAENIPLKRSGRPDDYGELAVFLASADSGWITGAEFFVDGGMSCL